MNRSINGANCVRPNWTRRITRAVFMAFVTLSLALAVGCGEDEDDKGGGGDGKPGDGGSSVNMPSSSVLSNYGLSGMTAPAGATNMTHAELDPRTGMEGITLTFGCTSASDASVHSSFTNSGWTRKSENASGDNVSYSYSKTGFQSGAYVRQGTMCQVSTVKE